MSSDSHSPRRDFFPNEDFEKTAQEIISSPRKGKHYQKEEGLYAVTEKQKGYYTKCFLHLLKATQKTASRNGALFGGDDKLLSFFRKSGLDDEDLSRIWALADVNEDGWLDLAEFKTAMHLIVLRVKGELPIPDELPPSLMPPISPPRTHSQISSESSRRSCESQDTSTTMQLGWSQFDDQDIAPNVTRSEERLTSSAGPPLAYFSDVPPLLVDGRPTAIKPVVSTTLPDAVLSLKSPRGPPPAPPSRPTTRGHMRSISLDLKQLNLQQQLSKSIQPQPLPSPAAVGASASSSSSSVVQPATGSSATSTSSAVPPVPSRSDVNAVSRKASTSSGVFRIPPPPVIPSTTRHESFRGETHISQPVTTVTTSLPTSALPSRLPDVECAQKTPTPTPATTNSVAVAPAPSVTNEETKKPAPVVATTVSSNTVSTQTEGRWVDPELVDKFINEFGSQLQDLLGREESASNGSGELWERWAARCQGLRAQNSELERERARLAQVRIQLELRLQETERARDGLGGGPLAGKPTPL